MRFVFALALAVTLGLSACGAGQEAGPAASTESSEPEAALPDVARVVCQEGATRIETPSVKPQEDGVHLEIVNETRKDLGLDIGESRKEPAMGTNAPIGTSTEILEFPSGSIWLMCRARGAAGPWAQLQIIDQDGYWLEGTGSPMACRIRALGVIDYVAEARGYPTPIQAVRQQHDSSIHPGDVLEQLGYPREATPNFALIRDGVTIAEFEVWSDDAGGWLVDSTSSCPPFGD